MNIIIIALFVSLAKSICYEHKTLMINGTNIVPDETPIGWIKFQPYNLSHGIVDDNYKCSNIEYYFKNITCEFYNKIYFAHDNTPDLPWSWWPCKNECSITIDCNTTMFYFAPDLHSNEKFDYEIIINQEKLKPDCAISIIIVFFCCCVVCNGNFNNNLSN